MFQYELLPSVYFTACFALSRLTCLHSFSRFGREGKGVLFSPLSNSVAIEDSHAHNIERNEKLFEKETNKAEELSDPSLLYRGKMYLCFTSDVCQQRRRRVLQIYRKGRVLSEYSQL
jgi:hypothetical protein